MLGLGSGVVSGIKLEWGGSLENLDVEIRHWSVRLKGKINRGGEDRDEADLLKSPVTLSQWGPNGSTYLKEGCVRQEAEGLRKCGSDIQAKKRRASGNPELTLPTPAMLKGMEGASLWLRVILRQSKAFPSMELDVPCFLSLTPLNIGIFVHQASFSFAFGFSTDSIRTWLSWPKY